MKKSIYALVLIIAIITTAIVARTTSPPVLLGDIDNNSRIDSMDMLLLKRHILDISKLNKVEQIRADINQDGKISNADLVMLRKYILLE